MSRLERIEQAIAAPGAFGVSDVLGSMRNRPLSLQAALLFAARRAVSACSLAATDGDLISAEFFINVVVSGGRAGGYDEYMALEALVSLFASRWTEYTRKRGRSAEAVLLGIKRGLARLADGGRLEDLLVTAALERLFTDRAVLGYFADWAHDARTSRAYSDAVVIVGAGTSVDAKKNSSKKRGGRPRR